MSTRYRIFPLFTKLRIATPGTTGAGGVYTYIDLDVQGLSQAVLTADSLELITLQKGANGNDLEWNVELIGGYDRDNEVTAIPLSATDINTNDAPVRAAAVTSVANFLPHSRLRIRVKNRNSVTGVNSALVSAVLLVKIAA